MNNGSAPVYLASSTDFAFANGGAATNTLSFALYSSAPGGSQSDSSITYIATSTAYGASSTIPFNLTYVSAANRLINGGSWRYLTVKNVGAPINNDSFQLAVSTIGNIKFHVVESDLGYSGNPASDTDLSDTITGLYIDGTPSLATVTAKT